MQFQHNSDHPAVNPDGSPYNVRTSSPAEFPEARPLPCARITTRIFHPKRKQVATVQNVIVKTIAGLPPPERDVDWSSDDDMSSDDSMLLDAEVGVGGGGAATVGVTTSTASPENNRAYWVQRTIREAIYGKVLMAVVLKRRLPSEAANDNAEWEVTDQFCAVKEMNWQHIRRERNRLAEDPIKEVSCMQYLKQWQVATTKDQRADSVETSFSTILETNIMMPLDLLTDDRHLYSVMPYCNGGELFERLDTSERFPEPEARYWMYQVLNGLENMQNAGICHRDMSLENLLVHKNGALIIDMGMCLRIPFANDGGNQLAASFDQLNVNGGAAAVAAQGGVPVNPLLLAGRSRPRDLISPQGTCGKWIYMSPEIFKNKDPFDGYAVDMWAAGVILFLMLTGFPPWERACQTDERFRYMTAGYMVQMLSEWEVGLSGDAMDLLQRMLFLDPKDRLSLDQVRAHPWMVNGPRQPPSDVSD